MGIKCRLIEEVGRRWEVIFGWHTGEQYHDSRLPITKEQFEMHDLDKIRELFTDKMPACFCCNQTPPPEASVSTGERRVWNTEDGENNHFGDMYFAPWMHEDGKCFTGWANCTDPRGHLIVVMPDGGCWDTDSRASNCTMKEDRNHRCWVKHGDAPNLTVDKQGVTCQAGAGSIQMISWHGFLRNGELVQ